MGILDFLYDVEDVATKFVSHDVPFFIGKTASGIRNLGSGAVNLVTGEVSKAKQDGLDAVIDVCDGVRPPLMSARDGAVTFISSSRYNPLRAVLGPDVARNGARWFQKVSSDAFGVQDESGYKPWDQSFHESINTSFPALMFTDVTGHRPSDVVGGTKTVPIRKLLEEQRKLLPKDSPVTVQQYNSALRNAVDGFKKQHGEMVAFDTAEGISLGDHDLYSDDAASKSITPVVPLILGLVVKQKIVQSALKNSNVIDNFGINKTISLEQLEAWRKVNAPDLPPPRQDFTAFAKYLEMTQSTESVALVDAEGHVIYTMGMAITGEAPRPHIPLPRTKDEIGKPTVSRPAPSGSGGPAVDVEGNNDEKPSKLMGFVQENKMAVGGLGIAATVLGLIFPQAAVLALLGAAGVTAAWGKDIVGAVAAKPEGGVTPPDAPATQPPPSGQRLTRSLEGNLGTLPTPGMIYSAGNHTTPAQGMKG